MQTPRHLTPMHVFLRTMGAPTDHQEHTTWTMTEAVRHAIMDTDLHRMEGDRSATVYVDRAVSVGPAAMAEIVRQVTGDRPLVPEVRSIFADAVDITRAGYPLPIERFQIKGVVFDAKEPPVTYGGDGWPGRNSFADKNGRACFYEVPKEAQGTCTVKEAVNEFNMTREALRRTRGSSVVFPAPLMWGQFDEGEFDGEPFGFVVLGLPNCPDVRIDIYRRGLKALRREGDFEPLARALTARTSAMRTMHDAGVIVPYQHMDNVSLTTGGHVLMHDMGDPRAMLRDHLLSDAQFQMETYLHLMYALSPPNIIPQPKSDEDLALLDRHIVEYTRAGLTGYYGPDSPVIDVPYDEWHRLMEVSFEEPLWESRNPIAVHHCAVRT